MPIIGGGSGGGGSSGAITLLSTTTRATDGTFDVSAISGTYNDLIVMIIARSTISATVDGLVISFNNDLGSNYYFQRLRGTAATASSLESLGGAGFTAALVPAATATANQWGHLEILIPGYASTTWKKHCGWHNFSPDGTGTGTLFHQTGGFFWDNTAALTRIAVTGTGPANLLTGSTMRIYGRL